MQLNCFNGSGRALWGEEPVSGTSRSYKDARYAGRGSSSSLWMRSRTVGSRTLRVSPDLQCEFDESAWCCAMLLLRIASRRSKKLAISSGDYANSGARYFLIGGTLRELSKLSVTRAIGAARCWAALTTQARRRRRSVEVLPSEPVTMRDN